MRAPPVSWLWAASLIVVWIMVALDLGQPVWAVQRSQDLVAYGALKGENFSLAESWRLVVSQWLHVKGPHMLFNAAIIAVVGAACEKRVGIAGALLIGLAGGTLGQLVSVYAYPGAFISGASQAYMALCGLLVIVGTRWSPAWWTAVVGLIIGAGLDLFVSDHGGLKLGHLAGVAVGLVAGGLVLARRRLKAT